MIFNYSKRIFYLSVICCLLTLIFTTSAANAAITKFRVSGKVMLPGDLNDTPVKGAKVSAVKFTGTPPNPPAEIVTESVLSGDDGSFSLDVDVDEDRGASDEFNKIQIRLEAAGDYVTVCSPFLELLYFKNMAPPVGNIKNLELSPVPQDYATKQLKAISDLESWDDVEPSMGIVVGSVEYDDGNDIFSIPGIRFAINGQNINGARIMYMDIDGKWNPQLDRTTSGGPFIVYNIPIDPVTGWNDVGLTCEQAGASLDYTLGLYPLVRVYPYEKDGNLFITDAHYKAEKKIYGEGDDGGPDDGGGGGKGCFISSAFH